MPALEVPDPKRAQHFLNELLKVEDGAGKLIFAEIDSVDRVKTDKELCSLDIYHLVCCQAKLPLEERKTALRYVIRGLRGPTDDDDDAESREVANNNSSSSNNNSSNNNNNSSNKSSNNRSALTEQERQRLIDVGREAASRLRKSEGKRTDETRGFEKLMMLHLVHLPPEHENKELLHVARVEAAGVIFGDPLLFADVVDGLDEETRKWLLDASPKGSQPVMARVMERGGYADQLATCLRILQAAYLNWHLIALASIGEFFLSYAFSRYYLCTYRLSHWIFWDSLLYMSSFAIIYHICTVLEPPFRRLRRDPAGLWERALLAYQSASVEEAATQLEVETSDLETAKRLLGALGLLVTFGQIWALFGAYYVLVAVWWGYCYLLAICLALGLVGFRLLCYLHLLRFLQHLAYDLQHLTSEGEQLPSSSSSSAASSPLSRRHPVPSSSAASPVSGGYGSLDDAAGGGERPNTSASSVSMTSP